MWDSDNSMAYVGNPATILLVDDDQTLRRFARRILLQQGFHAIEASGSVEALDLASADAQCVDLPLTNPIQLLDKKDLRRFHA